MGFGGRRIAYQSFTAQVIRDGGAPIRSNGSREGGGIRERERKRATAQQSGGLTKNSLAFCCRPFQPVDSTGLMRTVPTGT